MEYPPLTGPGGGNYPLDPGQGAPAAPGQSAIDLMIQRAATQYNIPPEILRGLLMQESGMKAGAVGAAGEIGLGQFMPATAKALGIDPSDPAQAIPGAAMYLRQNLNKFGSMDQALAAYNWGPGNLAKFGMAGAPQSVRSYVAKIMGAKGLVAPPSGGGGAMGGSGGPGAGAPLGAPTQTIPQADATPPQQPAVNPYALAQGGMNQAPSLGDLFATTAQNWQQQMAKNAGLV
jgi:Transglycosylase SLT domain